MNKQEEHELLAKEEEKSDSDESESSEYEEYSDSEEEAGKYIVLKAVVYL